MKHLAIAAFLVIGLSSMASADSLMTVTSVSALGPTESVDWSTWDGSNGYSNNYDPTFPNYTGYQAAVASLGGPMPLVQSNGSYANGTWFGDFNSGADVLYNQSNLMQITFNTEANDPGIYAIGFQVQNADAANPAGDSSNTYVSDYAVEIDAYDASDTLIGTACFDTNGNAYGCTPVSAGGVQGVTAGTTGNTGDNSAPFVGIISGVEIGSINITILNAASTQDFAIGSLESAGEVGPVPEPTTLLLFGTGLLAAARRLRRNVVK